MDNEYIESIIWLRTEIFSILHDPPPTMSTSLCTTDATISTYSASQLRGWLYQFYAETKQWDKYDEVHRKANLRHKRRRLDIDEATLSLREQIFAEIEPD